MKKRKGRNCFIVFFVIAAALTISVEAQEFRGFYGSSRELNNHAPSSRYFRSARYTNKNSGYIYSTRDAFNYESSPCYPYGHFYKSFKEHRAAFPATNLTINIFSPDYTRVAGTPEYYNKSSDYNNYNKRYYPSNNRRPAGTQTIKINGERFYKMNGNYYRVDRFENLNDINYQTNQQRKEYYKVKGQKTANGVYILPSDEYDNSDYFVDGYNSRDNIYTSKRRVDNTVSILQKEQKALQEENDELKQKLIEQQTTEFERKRRRQKVREDNEAEEQQEAQKDDIKWKEAKRNNESGTNAFYSNLNIGDIVDQVPQNSKVFTIDGKQTYSSPGNNYYQKQKNGKFKVVGIGGK